MVNLLTAVFVVNANLHIRASDNMCEDAAAAVVDDDDCDAGGDCVRQVESVSWCLAAGHLDEGLLCVVHQSSVTVCCISTTTTDFALTHIHNINITAIPQGHYYNFISYKMLLSTRTLFSDEVIEEH